MSEESLGTERAREVSPFRARGRREIGSTKSHRWPLALVVLAALGANCCGGFGSSSSSSVVVTVSPTSATVQVNGQAQFTASVTGTTNTSVTWEVNGKKNGNSNVGTITSTGVYTAPTSVPSSSVTVEAVSQDDTSVSGTASVTIEATKAVSVSPAAATVLTGNKQQFTATVTGEASTAVLWSVSGVENGNSTVGTIDSSGLYTAPATPPSGGSVTITATSVSDSTQSASASVTVEFGVGALKGQYALLVKGQTSSGTIDRAGSFVADGLGNISSAILDSSTSSGISTTLFGDGTYSITPDGRGALTMSNTVAGTVAFYFVLDSNDEGLLVETDSNVSAASGAFYAQDAGKFSVTGLSGSYVFHVSGADASGYPKSAIGRFTSDGAGHLSSGVLDINDNSSNSGATKFSSASYQMDATYGASYGRGSASINGLQFAFYIVDSTRAAFIETDTPAVASGWSVSQQTPPTTLTGFSGSFGFVGDGATESTSSSAGKATGRGGRFTADGAGNISDFVMESNRAGSASTIPSSGTDSGTYTIDSSGSGRGTITFSDKSNGNFTFVFYLVSSNEAVFQDTSSQLILDGTLLSQTTETIDTSTVAGTYAFVWTGNTSGEDDFSGQLTITSASSSNTTGTVDFNEAGTTESDATLTGTFTVNGDGTARNSLSLKTKDSSGNFSFTAIVIDANTFLVVSSNSNMLVGICRRQ